MALRAALEFARTQGLRDVRMTAATGAARARKLVLTRMPAIRPAVRLRCPTLGAPRSEIVTGLAPAGDRRPYGGAQSRQLPGGAQP